MFSEQVRVHPATGWKSLFLNRKYTLRIVGLEPGESQILLNYLFDVCAYSFLSASLRREWRARPLRSQDRLD